jgi:hypothetical protein
MTKIMHTKEAAGYINRSPAFLARQRQTGGGPPFVRVSPRAIGYRVADLDRWLSENTHLSTAEYMAEAGKSHD